MWSFVVAVTCTGLFAGAAVYITAVEHPARVSCGTELAVREFAPSYHRATLMQAPLALVGCAAGLWSAWQTGDSSLAVAALLIGTVVPFTLVAILPTNKRLLDPTFDVRSGEAAVLLTRWGRLHGVRTGLSVVAFVVMLVRLADMRAQSSIW